MTDYDAEARAKAKAVVDGKRHPALDWFTNEFLYPDGMIHTILKSGISRQRIMEIAARIAGYKESDAMLVTGDTHGLLCRAVDLHKPLPGRTDATRWKATRELQHDIARAILSKTIDYLSLTTCLLAVDCRGKQVDVLPFKSVQAFTRAYADTLVPLDEAAREALNLSSAEEYIQFQIKIGIRSPSLETEYVALFDWVQCNMLRKEFPWHEVERAAEAKGFDQHLKALATGPQHEAEHAARAKELDWSLNTLVVDVIEPNRRNHAHRARVRAVLDERATGPSPEFARTVRRWVEKLLLDGRQDEIEVLVREKFEKPIREAVAGRK